MPAAGIKRMKRMSGEAKPRKRPPSRYYLSNQPMEARHQSEDPCAAGSTRERGFREGAMVLGDTCLFVKNWTFLLGYQWRRDKRPRFVNDKILSSNERIDTIIVSFFFFQIKFYTNVKQFFYYCIINTTLVIWYFIFYLHFLRYKVTIFVKRRRVW